MTRILLLVALLGVTTLVLVGRHESTTPSRLDASALPTATRFARYLVSPYRCTDAAGLSATSGDPCAMYGRQGFDRSVAPGRIVRRCPSSSRRLRGRSCVRFGVHGSDLRVLRVWLRHGEFGWRVVGYSAAVA